MVKNIILMSCVVFASNLHAECSLEMSSGDLLKFNKREMTIDSSCSNFTIYFKHEGVMAAKTFGHNFGFPLIFPVFFLFSLFLF